MQPEGVLLSSSLTSWINLFLYWCRSYRKKDTTSPLRWLVLKNLLFAPMLALLQNWTLFLTVSNLSSSHLISYFCLVDWANCQIFHLQSNSRSQRLDLTLFDKKKRSELLHSPMHVVLPCNHSRGMYLNPLVFKGFFDGWSKLGYHILNIFAYLKVFLLFICEY